VLIIGSGDVASELCVVAVTNKSPGDSETEKKLMRGGGVVVISSKS
jgi:hypothetical protein